MSEPPSLNDLATRPFKPVAFYNRPMNQLYVLTRDCSVVEHWDKSGIDLLEDFDGKLVGVSINGFMQMAAWDICDAVMPQFPRWFRFLYSLLRSHRNRKLHREMKAAGFPFA